jgi:outer membrane protein TolC
MIGSRSSWRRLRDLVAQALVVPGLWLTGAGATAAPPDPPLPALTAPHPHPHPTVIDLAAARALAVERQPAVAAARASLAGAVNRKQAVDHLRVPTCLQPDLPIRRQQAELGPVAAEAGLRVAEMNAVYAAQYSYISYLYALSQLQLAEGSLAGLRELLKAVRGAVDELGDDPANLEGRENWLLFPADRERVRALIQLVEARRQEALVGSRRALSALREALNLQEECSLSLAHDRLLEVDLELDCQALVQLALAHRPEIVQVAVAAQATELEVAAQQCRKRGLRVSTFASGTDIHATPLPAGSYTGDYKPGALGPEMPVTINGRQCDRVAIASSYAERSHAVVEKTRNLVRLEVEQAVLRYQEARAKLRDLKKGIGNAEKATAGMRDLLEKPERPRISLESLLGTGLVSSQLRTGANEARYQMLLALVALERATGGAFCAGLDRAPEVPPSDGGLGGAWPKDNKPGKGARGSKPGPPK